MSLNMGGTRGLLLVSMVAGLIALLPVIVASRQAVGGLLFAVAIYAVFAGWLVVQQGITWNMRKGFLRVHSQVQIGMRIEEVEAIISREFLGKRPFAQVHIWGVQYTLDPSDGRFNEEYMLLDVVNGRVVSVQYLDD
jgi:hypothetical protein